MGQKMKRRINRARRSQSLKSFAARVSRQRLAAAMSTSYDGDRDLYDALGWKRTLAFDDYYQHWRRDGIGKRIITAFPSATWRGNPNITSKGAGADAFHEKWKHLIRENRLWHYMSRVDKLSGIGRYGALLLGFSGQGNADLKTPASSAKNLLFLRPLAETSAEIVEWEDDKRNPRFGKPKIYRVNLGEGPVNGKNTQLTKDLVHWTRIVHVAEDMEEDDIYGTPRLEAVFNQISGLELITGASPEMFWRGAFPGMTFGAEDGAEFDPDDEDDLVDEIEDYMHGLKRYLKTQGLKVGQLTAQAIDPLHHVEMLVNQIAGATGIPQRILMGSEEGKLASVQDENNWANRVDERRRDFAEPVILRPFIDRLSSVGVLPKLDSYEVEWPPPAALAEETRATIAKDKSEALSSYMNSAAWQVYPFFFFLRDQLGYSEDEANNIIAYTDTAVEPELSEEPQDEPSGDADVED